MINSKLDRSSIVIHGRANLFDVVNTEISKSKISIKGENNHIRLKDGVKLRNSTIIIRGNNCCVLIEENTTFGGIRIVNVGKGNSVSIGKDCLFADNIELWASDTHSIYDDNGKFINNERPVTIEDRVWVGSYVKILKGVTVGEGAVIGMNAMVTKSIMAKSLNVGSPAYSIKENISWSLLYENE